MMRQILLSVERFLPPSVRRLGELAYRSLPPSVRYGRVYVEAVKLLQRSQSWTRDEHEAFQLEELRRLITVAYTESSFYRTLYDKHGVSPSSLKSLSDIRLFPTVSKDDIRTSREQMRVSSFPMRSLQYHTTGGSTGMPVGLYWETNRTVPLERAFLHRQFRWINVELDRDRMVALRGIPVTGGRLFERLPGRQIRLSSYDMTPGNLDRYLEIIDDFQPAAILAYPSSAFILAQHVIDRGGHRFQGLRAVLCGSENFYPWQRALIERAFGCRAYSWYGQSEYVALGGECEHSHDYHFYSEYGVTEMLRQDGGEAGPGESGEIVATGFNNRAFPLIRYRTEDTATVSSSSTCPCGRAFKRVERVDGRLQEMIVASSGNLISMTAINMHSDVFDNVHQFQFMQDTPGEVTMRIVRRPAYSLVDEQRIRESLARKLRDQITITIEYADSIPLTARGKATFLDQRLSIAKFRNQA